MTKNDGREARLIGWFGALVAAGFLAGCVTIPPPAPMPPPPDTSVAFYPARGQSAVQQDRDKFECNGWAVKQSGFDPSSSHGPPHL